MMCRRPTPSEWITPGSVMSMTGPPAARSPPPTPFFLASNADSSLALTSLRRLPTSAFCSLGTSFMLGIRPFSRPFEPR